MKYAIYLLALFATTCGTSSEVMRQNNTDQNITSQQNSNEVMLSDVKEKNTSVEEVKAIVSYLASDELSGRNTGTEGIEKAAQYIETYFKKHGLKAYFQTYRDEFTVKGEKAFNVVAYLEGNDPELKNEFVVLGAHYDHIGKGKMVGEDEIANGANDNAAGTATVMEMAKYFSKTKSNKRSMLFALFSAEEMGLLGSKHMASKLKEESFNLHTMLNFEMVGVPLKDKDYIAYLTGYQKSNLAAKFNEYGGSKLAGFLPQAKGYQLFYRSDNYPFYKEFNKPCQTFCTFDFTNFDYYHHVDDEADKLDFEHMANFINTFIPGVEGVVNAPSGEIKMTE